MLINKDYVTREEGSEPRVNCPGSADISVVLQQKI